MCSMSRFLLVYCNFTCIFTVLKVIKKKKKIKLKREEDAQSSLKPCTLIYDFCTSNHYVLFLLKNKVSFFYFFSLRSRLPFSFVISIFKVLMYCLVILLIDSRQEKINSYNLRKYFLRSCILWKHISTYCILNIFWVICLWFCLIHLEQYIQFQKNQSIEPYFYEQIMRPGEFLYFVCYWDLWHTLQLLF